MTLSKFSLSGCALITILAPLSAGGCAASEPERIPSEDAVYLNTKSSDVLWVNERDGKVRFGDVIGPSGQCAKDAPYLCIRYFSISISIPRDITSSTKSWMDGGICYRVTGKLSSPNVYAIRMRKEEAGSCDALTVSESDSLLLVSADQGVIYFEDLEPLQHRSGWIKISTQGMLAPRP